jgi:hypothetical protein
LTIFLNGVDVPRESLHPRRYLEVQTALRPGAGAALNAVDFADEFGAASRRLRLAEALSQVADQPILLPRGFVAVAMVDLSAVGFARDAGSQLLVHGPRLIPPGGKILGLTKFDRSPPGFFARVVVFAMFAVWSLSWGAFLVSLGLAAAAFSKRTGTAVTATVLLTVAIGILSAFMGFEELGNTGLVSVEHLLGPFTAPVYILESLRETGPIAS